MTDVTIGSYWADNKIWMLGRVVQVVEVTDVDALVQVTNEPDQGRGLVPGQARQRSLIGKEYRIKLHKFRTPDRPLHGGFLPADGPHDGRTAILLREEVAPIRNRGLGHAPLLRLKYANGWPVTVVETGEVVDFEPRRKGDGQAWRDASGKRYTSAKCQAGFPNGTRMWFGVTTETNATSFPADDWLQVAHVLLGERDLTTACGVQAHHRVSPEGALGLSDDFDSTSAMCEKCEAESPSAVMAARVSIRLTGTFGVDPDVAGRVARQLSRLVGDEAIAGDGSFDTTDLDNL